MGDNNGEVCDKCGQKLPAKQEDKEPEENKDTDGDDMVNPSVPGTGI